MGEKIVSICNDKVIQVVDTYQFNCIDMDYLNDKKIKKAQKMVEKLGNFCLYIEFDKIISESTVYKNIVQLYRYSIEKKIPIGKMLQNNNVIVFANHFNTTNEIFTSFLDKIKTLLIVLSFNDLKREYSYVYDSACDYFERFFNERNLCDFIEDKCTSQRCSTALLKSKYKTMGCCHEFYYRKWDGMPIFIGECRYLTPKGCSIKCLGCKMYVCKYWRKNGIKKMTCDNYFLLSAFLNDKQKEYTNASFFKTKEEIMEYWLDNA